MSAKLFRIKIPLLMTSLLLVVGCDMAADHKLSGVDGVHEDTQQDDYGTDYTVKIGEELPAGVARWSEAFGRVGYNTHVTIPADVSMIMDVPETAMRSLSIHGELLFEDWDTHVKADWISVNGPNALLQIGTRENPLSSNIRITLTDPRYVYREHVPLDKSNTGASNGQILWHVAANGSKEARLNFGNYKGLMVMGGATLSIYSTSAEKTSWTQLAQPAKPGDTQLELITETGWQAGDRIALAPTSLIAEEAEDFTITAVNGKTLYLDAPVEHLHLATQQIYNDVFGLPRTLDMRAEVGLLSRNIVIEGDERSKELNYGAHTMFMYPSTVNISGLELRNCGQQGSQGRYCSHWHRPYVDNMDAIYQKPEFQEIWARTWEGNGKRPSYFPGFPDNNIERWARYMDSANGRSIYVHASAEDKAQLDQFLIESMDATGDYIRNSSVHTSFQRAVNLHGTRGVVVDNNVAYNVSNHTFVFAEDGNEHGNTMTNNLAVLVKNVLDRQKMAFLGHRIVLPDDLNKIYGACFESGRPHNLPQSPSCQEEDRAGAFWGENPFNTLTGNVAAGVADRGNGFFISSAFFDRALWDDDRGLYLMGRDMMGDKRTDPGPTIAPVPVVFENNRAHTISAVSSTINGDVNTYPPQITGAGFFFRSFGNRHSPTLVEANFLNLQGYGFQDHGIWFEDGHTVDGCMFAAGQKRLMIPLGGGNNIGAQNCVLISDTGEASHALTGISDSSRAFNRNLYHFAFGPNFGRAPGTFRPFLKDTVIYNHVGGVLMEDEGRGSYVEASNVLTVD